MHKKTDASGRTRTSGRRLNARGRVQRLLAAMLCLASTVQSLAAGAEYVTYSVLPSRADPSIERFDSPNVVTFRSDVAADAPLLIYLPGTTRAQPGRNIFRFVTAFLNTGADHGYRVIALQYDTFPAVIPVCAAERTPSCPEDFRIKRTFGTGTTAVIDDRPQEAIVNRLTALLKYLDVQHPAEHWSQYLDRGEPRWDRIAVAGHSQGAGMAALIAKHRSVARVVLLSGPADTDAGGRDPAAWLSRASATPPERWFALFHENERRAAALARAYKVLAIPPAHVHTLTLDPNPQAGAAGWDPNHVSVVADRSTPRDAEGRPRYAGDWAFLVGGPR